MNGHDHLDGYADTCRNGAALTSCGGAGESARRRRGLAEIVDLKYFCGFSFAEIAKLQGTSERTVQRDWQKGRLLLYRHINDSAS